ncbi:MAG: glycoside hydrolase family 28 protein, partial [Bacteroidales bacterium]|nr:glycoside hydrolase family 28 protein [Bacteroidales bacterium]
MKKLLPLISLCVALASCTPSAKKQIDPMDEAMQRVVASIQTTSFPDRIITVDAPVEADALLLLQEAIDSCSAQGGGTVVANAGVYRMGGTLWLKSNVRLELLANAQLLFSGRGDDFLSVMPTRWEGTELLGRSAMIAARDAENIAITGAGEIDAQAGIEMAAWGMQPGTSAYEETIHGTHGETVEMADVNRLRAWGERRTLANTPKDSLLTFGEGTFLRPCCVEFNNCRRVLVDGVTVRNSPFWCLHPLYCTDVTVRGVTIDSHFPNNDGCDPESSERVLIEDCLFRTGDDAVAIKSGRDADGRRVGRPSRQIVIRRCQFQSECNGLCIGSEMSGGVEEVFMDSVAIGHVKNALLFKSNKDRGGYIRNVWVRNITVDETAGAVLRFENNYFGYRDGNFPSHYADF